MTKVTFANKVDTVSNPAPQINKATASDFNELKASINAIYESSGWIAYIDSVNTSANKQVLTAEIDNNITIVDADPIDTYKPLTLGSAELWQGNKITPKAVGDTYTIRLDFKASINNLQGYFDLKLDIDGAIGDILIRNETFPKGANVEHGFSLTSLIYCLDTFFANGANIQINPSHEMLIWDKVLVIQRNYCAELF